MTTKLSRRSAIAALAASTAAAGAAQALAAGPDPVFSAIEKHKAATLVCCAAHGDDNVNATTEAENEVRKDLFLTVPTTVAGVAAVLEYVTRPEYTVDDAGPVDFLTETILCGACSMTTTSEAALAFLPKIAARLRLLATAEASS